MDGGAGSKERRGRDLKNYCNSRHYSTPFNYPRSPPFRLDLGLMAGEAPCLAVSTLALVLELLAPRVIVRRGFWPRQSRRPRLRGGQGHEAIQAPAVAAQAIHVRSEGAP